MNLSDGKEALCGVIKIKVDIFVAHIYSFSNIYVSIVFFFLHKTFRRFITQLA